jgi:cardiolipin synthase A/B
MSHRSIIVLPEDSIIPLIHAITGARNSIHIKMFIFTEPALLHSVIAAAHRGVKVKVMLNPARSNGESPNEESKVQLVEAGVIVKDSSPEFKVTHEKSMVIDENIAYIQSLNWSPRHLKETRDYCVVTTHPREVAEILECFECDWDRIEFSPGETSHLIWCKGNGRARLAHFIDNAKHSLFIQNDRYQDLVIIERLIRAAQRGVKVHVMSPPPHSLKFDKLVEGVGGLRVLHDVGIKIHNLTDRVLHAKLLFADGKRAIIGSINLTTGSFDDRRELAIELSDDAIIERLEKVAHHDWKHSYKLDLSDKGLLEDLENRGSGGAEKLVLNAGHKKKHKH